MKTDARLKVDFKAELAWEPSADTTQLGVLVRDGIVALSGRLDSLANMATVERAAARVSGVRGVTLDIEVRPPARALGAAAHDIAHAACALNTPQHPGGWRRAGGAGVHDACAMAGSMPLDSP